MADKDILQRVIEVFATMTETADEITADSQLIEDLEISSMDVLYLISSLEEEFKIKVSERLSAEWPPSVTWRRLSPS